MKTKCALLLLAATLAGCGRNPPPPLPDGTIISGVAKEIGGEATWRAFSNALAQAPAGRAVLSNAWAEMDRLAVEELSTVRWSPGELARRLDTHKRQTFTAGWTSNQLQRAYDSAILRPRAHGRNRD